MACLACKKRKQKCDGNRPCARCKKLNIDCVYGADKRTDKRRLKDGCSQFVFKNQTFCKSKSLPDASVRKIDVEPKPLSVELLHGHESLHEQNGSSNVITPNESDAALIYASPAPLDLDFDFKTFENCDVDDFLRLLGENFPAESEDPVALDPFKSDSTQNTAGSMNSIEEEELSLERVRLIDVIFEDGSHFLPGIPKDYVLKLEELHSDLKPTGFDSNGKFLLSAILCLGALTLRKRELLDSSTDPPTPNGIPQAAADAYKYFVLAKSLIPEILSNPKVDGFCGLVLMGNFMTIMISTEGQLYLLKSALEVAVALHLHQSEFHKQMQLSGSDRSGVIFLFWNVWSCAGMISTSLGQEPFLPLENITAPSPAELEEKTNLSPLSVHFMQLRIQLVALQTKIFHQLYVLKSTNRIATTQLEKELEALDAEITEMRSTPFFDEELYYRSRVLLVELSCLKAHCGFLLYRPGLIGKSSFHAVSIAKSIIYEIWSRYTRQFPQNQKELVNHLDWNFCYPLRTASLTLWIACTILRKYQQMIAFLPEEGLFEYNLGLEVLNDLIQIVPIEEKLVKVITGFTPTLKNSDTSQTDDSLTFWSSMLR